MHLSARRPLYPTPRQSRLGMNVYLSSTNLKEKCFIWRCVNICSITIIFHFVRENPIQSDYWDIKINWFYIPTLKTNRQNPDLKWTRNPWCKYVLLLFKIISIPHLWDLGFTSEDLWFEESKFLFNYCYIAFNFIQIYCLHKVAPTCNIAYNFF